jgi:hypothetical protein
MTLIIYIFCSLATVGLIINYSTSVDTFDEIYLSNECCSSIYTVFKIDQCNGTKGPETYQINSHFNEYYYQKLMSGETRSLFSSVQTGTKNLQILINQNGTVWLDINYLDYNKSDKLVCQFGNGVKFYKIMDVL